MSTRIVRLSERNRPAIPFELDGRRVEALAGDTLLTAMLVNGSRLRSSEFGSFEPRAGFCLMGACQDCWVWTEDGTRLRACSTPVQAGMRVRTDGPPIGIFDTLPTQSTGSAA